MTERIGKTLFISTEKPQQCDYCGVVKELRPYGKKKACICFDCAMKPENKAETEKQLSKLLDGEL